MYDKGGSSNALPYSGAREYFKYMAKYALIVEELTGIHAPLVLAWWGHESGYGTNPSSAPGLNNHAGISANSSGNDRPEESGNYAQYFTIENFAKDYAHTFTGSSYQALRDANKNNWIECVYALNSSPYAEDKYPIEGIISMAQIAKQEMGFSGQRYNNVITSSGYRIPSMPVKIEDPLGGQKAKYVTIENIIKKGDIYKFKLLYDGRIFEYDLKWDTIGDLLKNVIKDLGIDINKQFPNILSGMDAYFEYYTSTYDYSFGSTYIPLKLEVLSSAELVKVDEYLNLENKRKSETIESKNSGYVLIKDNVPNDLYNSNIPHLRGNVVSTVDGDTIDVKVTYASNVTCSQGANEQLLKQTVRIRFSGLEARETYKDYDDGYSEQKNLAWLKKEGIYSETNSKELLQKTYDIANEAKTFVSDNLKGQELLILIDNYPNNIFESTSTDLYGRLLGIVYIANSNGDSLYNYINLNKSLLANEAKSFPGQPLAKATVYYDDSDGRVLSRYDVASWILYEYGFENRIEEVKDSSKTIVIDQLGEFLDSNNVSLDNDGVLVYNDISEIQIETQIYDVTKEVTIDEIVKSFSKGDAAYTKAEYIAVVNNMSVEELILKLSNRSLIGTELTIPIFKKENKSPDFLNAEYQTSTNIIPADSEMEDYAELVYDDRDRLDGFNRNDFSVEQIDEIYESGFTRIGDCTLSIPPLSIKVDSIAQNQKFPTLRSKSSIQTQIGHTTRLITMDLFFNGEDQINGELVTDDSLNQLINAPSDIKQDWFRNGLRPLIAQFKRAPFLPIENKLLNDSFRIKSVALKDLSLNTVPGFPSTIQATLVMYEFDHTTYMLGEEDFAGTINWKMFRWYYQQIMQKSNNVKGKTYLEYIETLDDSIRFFTLKEEELAKRQEAIKTLDYMLDPMAYIKTNTDIHSESGLGIRDSSKIRKAEEQKAIFDQWVSKHPMSSYPLMYDNYGLFIGPDIKAEEFKDAEESKKYLLALLEMLSVVYFEGQSLTKDKNEPTHSGYDNIPTFEEDETMGTHNGFFVVNNVAKIRDFVKQKLSTALSDSSSLYTVPIMLEFSNENFYFMNIESEITHEDLGLFYQTDPSGGFYRMKFFSQENKFLFDAPSGAEAYKDLTDEEITELDLPYIISPSKDFFAISKIKQKGEASAVGIDNYVYEYNEQTDAAYMSEAEVGTEEFPINGNFWVENMSVIMSNNLVPLQVTGVETPTFQFLGSSDAQVSMTIRTKSKETVRDFRDLMSKVQRLARDYRIGITSGILTIENNMLALMGTKDVLIETINIQTVPDDKESYRISLVLTAFDKTQSAREDLHDEDMGSSMSSDTFYDYSSQKKQDNNFEYAAVDFKLRNLELYPDLELPTYADLNQVLPYFNMTFPNGRYFSYMPNPGGAKYLDPDFYIRTVNTIGAAAEDNLLNQLPGAYLQDDSGFEVLDIGPLQGQTTMQIPNVEFSTETLEWINSNLEVVDVGKIHFGNDSIKSSGEYSNFASNQLTVESAENRGYEDHMFSAINASELAVLPSYINIQRGKKNFDIDKYILEFSKDLTDKQLENMYSGTDILNPLVHGDKVIASRYRQYRKNIVNPEPSDVYKEIENQVAIIFANLPFDENMGKGPGSPIDTYTYGPTRISAPIITQQKIANVIKSIFHVESGWTHVIVNHKSINPYLDSTGKLGIGGLQINSGIFQNEAELLKCGYYWKEAVKKSIEYFAWCYNKAIAHGDNAGLNPLDWAIYLYGDGAGSKDNPFNTIDLDSNVYYKNIINCFAMLYGASAALSNATPQSLSDDKLITVEETTERVLNIHKLLDAYLLFDTYYGDLDMDNPKERAMLEEQLGEVLGIDNMSLDFIKAIPFAKMDNYLDNNEKDNLISDKKFITVEDVTTVLAVDPTGQFLKSERDPEGLPHSKNDITRQYAEDESYLFHLIGDHLNRRIVGEDAVDEYWINKRKKDYKVMSPDSYSEAFDYNTHAILIADGAYEYMQKTAIERSDIGDVGDHYGWIFDWHIDWSKIYKLIPLKPITIQEKKDFEELGESVSMIEAGSPFLREANEIVDSYRSSFYDLTHYDRRGRMVQAFPTFQMFLIDEGRWMLWHKMWDNFYGYNSVVSIDVMRDRRIAADTAVIQLSNLYHNLNTKDKHKDFGDSDGVITDLLFGDPADREESWRRVFNLPDDEIIRARAEKIKSLILKPGARIHLRIGYGSNAFALPIVFNGVITEMDAQEVVTIVAQGDGIELTNKMNVDPDATTDPGLFSAIKEPRQTICELLTSKGSFFKNFFNHLTGGVFFNKHPLGIAHFGNQILPKGLLTVDPIDLAPRDYGEAGLNVYSGGGYNTFSQWIYTHGEKRGKSIGWGWFSGSVGIPWAKGDEPSVQIYLFDKTPWDVFQIYAAVCPDYIATSHPFEYRSTLFFGKPHWGLATHYAYKYKWNDKGQYLARVPQGIYRKSYSQMRYYDSNLDIIKNGIVASATNMYTNVIGVYNERDGAKKTAPIQVDSDIYPQFQRTAMVHVPIQATKYGNYFTQAKYVESASTSALRDFVKEMYQGELVVLGDPTVKPYDRIYLNDEFTSMKGITEVKRVVHNFSYETGFVTSISPDCISVIDDSQAISCYVWQTSQMDNVGAMVLGLGVKQSLWRTINGLNDLAITETLRRYGQNGIDLVFNGIIKDKIDDAIKSGITNIDAETLKNLSDITAYDWKAIIRGIGTKDFNLGYLKDGVTLQFTDELLRNTFKGYKTYSPKVTKIVKDVLDPIMKIYADPKITGKIVDDLWDATNILSKRKWFEGKGLIRGAANFGLRNTSKVVKVGVKAGARTTASGLRAIGWVLKDPVLRGAAAGFIVDAAFSMIVANAIERYQRYLRNRQALTIIPLRYRNKNFVAGIDGHQGSVTGDTPSKFDKFLDGTGMAGEIISPLNAIIGIEVDYNPDDYYTGE